MYFQNVMNISIKRSLRASELARLAGVSRAAITKWRRSAEKNDWVNVETKTLQNLARGLEVSPAYFLQPRRSLVRYQTHFLWDALYPDMESFVRALVQKRLPAMARLVQIVGFDAAKKIAGKKMIMLFPEYKKFIKPARRQQLENLWPLYLSQV